MIDLIDDAWTILGTCERVKLDEALWEMLRNPDQDADVTASLVQFALVQAAAEQAGIPEDARHLEYFSTPEVPDYVNHPFALRLSSGREIAVPAELSAADALNAAGIPVDVKCADGLCGVCKCGVRAGAVEHRDFVLSAAQRADTIILCQSRAADPGGVLEIDL